MTSFVSRSLLAGLLAGAVQFGVLGFAFADTTLLNVSYDPTRELYKEFNAAFAAQLEGRDRRDGHHPAVAWRLRQAGPRGDRRPRGRCRDAGARGRHRRHRQEDRQDRRRLAQPPAEQLRALHLDHRVPGPQGQSEGHQGLGRSGQGRRRGHHAEPEDLGRRALELSRRLGLGRTSSSAATRPRSRHIVAELFKHVPGARHRRARLDHDLRAARHRRRAARLGERGLPGARRIRRRQVRDRRARRSRSWPSRRSRWSTAMSTPRARARSAEAYLELPLLAGRPDDRRPSTTTGRPSPSWCRPTISQRFPKIELVTIDDPIFGGWAKAQPTHFGDGGIFDQIYKPAQ